MIVLTEIGASMIVCQYVKLLTVRMNLDVEIELHFYLLHVYEQSTRAISCDVECSCAKAKVCHNAGLSSQLVVRADCERDSAGRAIESVLTLFCFRETFDRRG